MAGWRDIKAKARATVHDTFEVPAVYLPTLAVQTAIRVNVRVHARVATRENEFTWPATSGMFEMTPKLIFKVAEIAKIRPQSLVIVSATEMYRMGASEPQREGYLAAECSEVPADEIAVILNTLGTVSGPIWTGILP
jgi:hypothetical protein